MAERAETSKAEFAVLKVLWKLKHGTVAEVRARYAEVNGVEPAYTTVMTLLSRLVAKGAVKVDKEREPYLYRPASTEGAVLRSRLRQFLDTVFDGDASELVLHLVKDEALSADELRRIEKKLEQEHKPGRKS